VQVYYDELSQNKNVKIQCGNEFDKAQFCFGLKRKQKRKFALKMVLGKVMRKNKYLVYGLVAVLVLNMLCSETNAKLLFCKNCRTAEPASDSTTINTGNILTAPTKCPPGRVPDRKNVCRKLVFN
jgi:hypothetical protein